MNITIEFLSEFLAAGRQRSKSAAEIHLGYREVYQQDGDLRGVMIVPMEGQVWVTQRGDPEDHTLGPGERFTITRRGRVVVQGINQSRFRLVRE
jgi:hypothetical protein